MEEFMKLAAQEISISNTVGNKKEGFYQFCRIIPMNGEEISFWMGIDPSDVPEEGTYVLEAGQCVTVGQIISSFCGHESDEISYGELKTLINMWDEEAMYFVDKFKVFSILREKDNTPLSDEEKTAWSTLMDKLSPLCPPSPIIEELAVGQIWSTDDISNKYSSPLVLVTDIGPDWVRVMQVSPSSNYAGEGDIFLKEGGQFVETWNVYSVSRKLLRRCIDVVGLPLLSEIVNTVSSSDVYGDILKFRKLEIAVGAELSIPSLGMIKF